MFWNCFVLFPILIALFVVLVGFYRIHFPLKLDHALNLNKSMTRYIYSSNFLGNLGCCIAMAALLTGCLYKLATDAYITSDWFLISGYFGFYIAVVAIFRAFFNAAIPKGIFIKTNNPYLRTLLTANGEVDLHLKVKPSDKSKKKTIIKSIVNEINSLSNYNVLLSPPYSIDVIVNQIEKSNKRIHRFSYCSFESSIFRAILITFVLKGFESGNGSFLQRINNNRLIHQYVFYKNEDL